MKIQESICVLAVLGFATARLQGQISLPADGYFESFDSLASGLGPGWSLRTNASATTLGIEAAFTTNNTSWGSTAGQFANYASTSNGGTNLLGTESAAFQNTCTNRCLGIRQTGTFGDPGAAFLLHLQNTLGLRNFQLSVDLNTLTSLTRSTTWLIDYGVGSSPSSFTTIWTHADPGVFGAVTTAISFGQALDDLSEEVWIRIVALDPSTGSGSRDAFGIDNFRLSYQSSGVVSPIPLTIERFGSDAVLTWANPAFTLETSSLVVGPYTNISGATSPFTNSVSEAERYFRLKAN